MRKLTTILFDLDGTLLPMNQEVFTKAYFGLLAKRCAPMGIAPDELVPAVWAATKAMVQNDGEMLNRERFWDAFSSILGEDVRSREPEFDRFYGEEFHGAKAATSPTPLAGECVRLLREKGYRLALATNPIFPLVGVHSRMAWAGVDPADFERITHYDNSHYCKPNPDYYREILTAIGAEPADCLMVGNDVREDLCAAELGCGVYLVTDCLEHGDVPHEAALQGSFEEFREWVRALPPV